MSSGNMGNPRYRYAPEGGKECILEGPDEFLATIISELNNIQDTSDVFYHMCVNSGIDIIRSSNRYSVYDPFENSANIFTAYVEKKNVISLDKDYKPRLDLVQILAGEAFLKNRCGVSFEQKDQLFVDFITNLTIVEYVEAGRNFPSEDYRSIPWIYSIFSLDQIDRLGWTAHQKKYGNVKKQVGEGFKKMKENDHPLYSTFLKELDKHYMDRLKRMK